MALSATRVSRIYALPPQRPTLARFVVGTTHRTTVPPTPFRGLFLVRASNPERGDTDANNVNEPDSANYASAEDLNYLMRLGAGSIAGAAAIKYGSIIFPEITRPNILQALIMISAPVLIAVFLLIKQSRTD